jgi:hypothetical protein
MDSRSFQSSRSEGLKSPEDQMDQPDLRTANVVDLAALMVFPGRER